MIKKIDANEYGVVRYAITSVDELNRLPKKIAPSSQAILIENGLRVFVYGDGQWVEEVVDGDLSENMKSIVADYERSKIGYDGVKRGSLEERLKDDFQGIYDILNARDYCEYSGKELKVDNTWMGNQIDTRVEGRTLQNLFDYNKVDVNNSQAIKVVDGRIKSTYISWDYRINVTDHLLKKDGVYTVVIDLDMGDYSGDLELRTNVSTKLKPYKQLVMPTSGIYVCKYYTTAETLEAVSLLWVKGDDPATATGTFNFGLMILEGDHTQTPLSELPYFEGIESVGEREIGKNLFDGVLELGGYDVNGTPTTNVSTIRSKNYIGIDANKQYCISLKDYSNYFYIHCYDKDKKNIGEVSTKAGFKPLEGCEYITFNTYTGVTSDLNSPVQLEEGTQVTPYEPFGYKIKGKSCGKNLIDLKKVKGNTTTSINVIDNNTLEVSTNSGWHGILFDDIELKTGKKYTFAYDCEDGSVTPYMTRKENGVYGTTTHYGGKNPIVITPTNDMTVRVSISSKQVMDKVIIKNIILTESDDISYQPYQESTYSVHSPIPLRSLPNGVCDVYDFESGAVIQRVGKVVLDGSEDWLGYESYDDDVTKWFRVDGLIKANNRFLSCISDKFICVMSSTHTLTGVGEVLSISPTSNGRLNLRINKDKLSSLDVNGFKLWLQANPTTVYYELEEPIIHYLTPSQLKSFEGTTHVISENTLIPTTTTKILTSTYANVSNVNSTAYSLRRGVNVVAETSAIINETDAEQDDVLDITMCAIDELYSMLEPNLE